MNPHREKIIMNHEFAIETVQVDHFNDDMWKIVGSADTFDECLDQIASPLFYVERNLFVRVIGSNEFVYATRLYRDGEWKSLDVEMPYDAYRYATLGHITYMGWLNFWKKKTFPKEMIRAYEGVVPDSMLENAVRQCAESICVHIAGGTPLDKMKSLCRDVNSPILIRFCEIIRKSISMHAILDGIIP